MVPGGGGGTDSANSTTPHPLRLILTCGCKEGEVRKGSRIVPTILKRDPPLPNNNNDNRKKKKEKKKSKEFIIPHSPQD